MAVPTFRWLTEDDKKRLGAKMPQGKPAQMAPPPPLQKKSPRATAEDVAARVLGSMLSNREQFAFLVKTMRELHGAKVSWMSDEQVAEFARKVYEEKARESATRVFNSQGRGAELVVRADGG